MRRRGMALALAVALVAFAAPTAFAVKPVTEPLVGWEGTDVLTGYCAFPLTVDYSLTGTVTSFYDRDGVLVKQEYHFYEVDTFSANGKTGLSGARVNAQWIYDSGGNLLKQVTSGTVEDIRLPDGTRFHSAGRTDFLNPPRGFALVPDHGLSGDLDALCAAFAP
jgi:hypothetical protein